MDETCWRLDNGTLHTIARRGADDVTVDLSIDEKTSITVICAITAAGHKLPPWAIIKGKTARCEQRYRDSPKIVTGRISYLIWDLQGESAQEERESE